MAVPEDEKADADAILNALITFFNKQSWKF